MRAVNIDIKLRKATTKDVEEILKLMSNYYSYEGLGFKKRDSKKALLGLLSNDEYGLVDVILVHGHVIGYICITYGYSLEYVGRDCVLDEIYVVPEYQRKGIGSTILTLIERQLNRRGFKAIHLEVFAKNKPARDFFVKNGFFIHNSSFMSKILRE